MTLKLAALSAIITSSVAYDVSNLDAAILQDILEAYTEHQPSTCTGDAAASTSFTYDFPGTNADSNWYDSFQPFEQDLFLAAMTHTDESDRSWTIRLGQGGNIYSHFCPDLHGETLPPQAHLDAPWIDEVHQSVSVNNNLNFREGMCNSETCPAYFIHGAGAYQRDDPYTSVPFYSQSLAKHCDGATCTFAAWGQQAHVATIFTSPIITLNRYTNCGNGIIEHTEMLYNFAPTGSPPHIIDQGYFNVPWSGVRSSTLPIALEPDPLTGDLNYEDPDTVDYCPLCGWGNDSPGGPQGRCERADLQDLGGYTSFVGQGLQVNRPTTNQKPFVWCRKPNTSCFTDPATCMANPDECYNADGTTKTGYTPVIMEIPANSTPDCRNRGEFSNGWELKCRMRRTGFGRNNPNLSTSTVNDACSPWESPGTLGFYREDTNQGFDATFIRHWSHNPNAQWMYFRVDAASFTEAKNMVHSVFDNTGNNQVLPIKFQGTQSSTSSDVPSDYNPGALPSVTFVAGDGVSSLSPGSFRRRMGSSNRDFTVYTINYYGGQANLEAGYALSKRAFVFASDLASVKETADSLKSNVVYDVIEETRYNPRKIDLYKSGNSFDVVAAASAEETSTTCTSASASLECAGFSTPTSGYSPYFYVTCGSSSYLGPDPYYFTPGNGVTFTFPGMSNNNDEPIRSYVCDGEDASVRPTWKLIGFFDSTCIPQESVNYDDDICVVPSEAPSSEPSAHPSLGPTPIPSEKPSAQPSVKPSAQPSRTPSQNPSLPPSTQPTFNPSHKPSEAPSSRPSSTPSVTPTAAPVRVKQWLWCSRPGGCNSSNESNCMAPPSECYTDDGYGTVKPGYTPIEMSVGPWTHPQCRDRGKFGNGYELMCNLHTTGFGRTRPYLSPPEGHTMRIFREDTNAGFDVNFIRHWSWRASDKYMYIRVDRPNFRAARNLVHGVLSNVGNNTALPVKFELRNATSLFE